MSMFDRYKILHGLPNVGQKITFIKPTPSWFTNVEEDAKLLIPGKEYTVRKTLLNSSSTYVWLKELDKEEEGRDLPFFNMASFKWEKPEIDMKDLEGFHLRDLLTLNRTYGWGILNYKGNPTLMTEIDDKEIVTKAWLVYE